MTNLRSALRHGCRHRALAFYFSVRICYMFIILKYKEELDLGLYMTSGFPQRIPLRNVNFLRILFSWEGRALAESLVRCTGGRNLPIPVHGQVRGGWIHGIIRTTSSFQRKRQQQIRLASKYYNYWALVLTRLESSSF